MQNHGSHAVFQRISLLFCETTESWIMRIYLAYTGQMHTKELLCEVTDIPFSARSGWTINPLILKLAEISISTMDNRSVPHGRAGVSKECQRHLVSAPSTLAPKWYCVVIILRQILAIPSSAAARASSRRLMKRGRMEQPCFFLFIHWPRLSSVAW